MRREGMEASGMRDEWFSRIGDVLIGVGILAANAAFALWTLPPLLN